MYWWVAPSSLFVVVSAGIASLSSILVVVRCCPSFTAIRLRSCLSRIVKSFSVAGLALGDG